MASSRNKVYVIAGPTAVGKTAVAIALAQQLGTSIVSADSRQCYREMSIGTAKPTAGELAAVPHYFIDSHSVTEHLTAADYEKLALGYLEEIFHHKDTAVVCGGTGLYIKALCEGIDEMPEVDAGITAQVNEAYRAKGINWLQAAVQIEDPRFFADGEIHNPTRMARALAFVRATGHSILDYRSGQKKQRPFTTVKIALELPREILYDRINRRVDIMMQQGLLDEVKALYPLRHLKNLQTVGYTELFGYLDGKYTLEEAVDKIKQHTRNYAKRQLTWFRKDKEYHWFRADEERLVEKVLML